MGKGKTGRYLRRKVTGFLVEHAGVIEVACLSTGARQDYGEGCHTAKKAIEQGPKPVRSASSCLIALSPRGAEVCADIIGCKGRQAGGDVTYDIRVHGAHAQHARLGP